MNICIRKFCYFLVTVGNQQRFRTSYHIVFIIEGGLEAGKEWGGLGRIIRVLD